MADLGSQYGPYPDDWSPDAIHFFNSEPQTFREFYPDLDEWEELTDAFDRGWVRLTDNDGVRLTREDHEEGRQDFYRLTATQESSFDWEAYREYLHSIGS